MATQRRGHTATLLRDGRVLVVGGYTGSAWVAAAEAYDPATNSWSSVASMSVPRHEHTATLLTDGRVLVAGGTTGQSTQTATAEVYDPVANAWTTVAPMSTVRCEHTATLLNDGRVLVAGGTPDFGPYSTLAAAELYDVAANQWTDVASMATTRRQHTATLLIDGRVLVEGGQTTDGSGFSASAEVYDQGGNFWTILPTMISERSLATAGLLSDGKVLVAGGYTADGQGTASAQMYDPIANAWIDAPNMSTVRYGHSATLLADGRVLVTGGGNSSGILATAEIFSLLDATGPEVSCGTPDGAWHASDVTISCTSADPQSGLANPADATFSLTTTVPAGTETAAASTGSRQVCNNDGGCTTAGPITGNKVDKKPPTVTITSPAANATYQLNAIIGSNYACSDAGSSVASCQGPVANGNPINTSSTGIKQFTVTATDNVGNQTTSTVTYSVVSGGGGGQTSADVGITLSAPGKVSPGATLTYSMTVTNAGKASATGVVVSDALPTGTVFSSVSSSQGTVTAPGVGSNGTVTVNVGTLAKGATAIINIVVTVTAPSGAVLNNTVTVSATTQDLNSNNNSATKKTTVSKN